MNKLSDATPGLLLRFAQKCQHDSETECWNWTGAFNSKGYPCIKVHGRTQYAHRISHILFLGEIPEDEQVHHGCQNAKCVNPSHLEAVTAKQNRDMQAAGVGSMEEAPF